MACSIRHLPLLLLAALPLTACTGGGRESMASGPTTPTAWTAPAPSAHTGERFEDQSPATEAWEFAEGLSMRITGVRRLPSELGSRASGDVRLALLRVDFTYTNHGSAVNLSDGRQLPVRLLYGAGRTEAVDDPGYVGSSDQLTVRPPTTIEPGATVLGARSFAVPVLGSDVLAALVVEPRRYTEHLFTDVQLLLTAG